MKIGIIGSLGIVGSALKFGFQNRLGHEIKEYDLKLEGSKIEDVLDSQICYVCVPTPKKEDGACDISIVLETVAFLTWFRYKGIIAIKSTCPPGTTGGLQIKYPLFRIAFVPEFLKERSATIDFSERMNLLVIGSNDQNVCDIIEKCHGNLPKRVVRLSPSEAEMTKYFSNCYGAMNVVFANSFYELCKKYNIEYSNVKNALAGNMPHIPNEYLDCNDQWRSYAGLCWSKDLPALAYMANGTNIEWFQKIINENEKYKKTVPEGMREK